MFFEEIACPSWAELKRLEAGGRRGREYVELIRCQFRQFSDIETPEVTVYADVFFWGSPW
jgi:hypothetical protein